MQKPRDDWEGFTVIDGFGKVVVRINNGYLETGYRNLNDAFPTLLRYMDSNGLREWVSGANETPIPELRGMFPNAVAQYYHGLLKNMAATSVKISPTSLEHRLFEVSV